MTAIWTQPRTWSVGEMTTAALMNQHLRDNLDYLKTPSSITAQSSTNFTTTSTSATDLTWATATLTTGGGGVDLNFRGVVGSSGAATVSFYLVVDGVSSGEIFRIVNGAADIRGYGFFHHIAALSAASHTIKLQTSISSGTLTVYGSGGSAAPQYYVIERGG